MFQYRIDQGLLNSIVACSENWHDEGAVVQKCDRTAVFNSLHCRVQFFCLLFPGATLSSEPRVLGKLGLNVVDATGRDRDAN